MTRLTATVMFTDIVESTARARRAGARADDERREHFGLVRNALRAHHGREVKTIGDGFMAVFASAADAIECAVALQQAVEANNRGRPDPVSVRVGLGVGDVTEEDGDCFGTPVIEANRLCDLAAPKQILATTMVRALSGRATAHPFRELGPVALKGLPDVDAVEVTWVPRVRGGVHADFARVDERDDDAIPVAEAIWAMPHMRDVRDRVVALLAPEPGQTLLDAGCGTGRDVLALAAAVGPTGKAIGTDASERMIDAAQALARDEGVHNVEFRVATLPSTGLDDSAVDGAVSIRTFQYLAEPLAAVRELRRVTRPGGHVVVTDTAWETSVWDGADPELTARVSGAWLRSRPAGRVAQQLYGLFGQAGLRDVRVEGVPNIVTSIRGNYDRVVATHASQAVERNAVTPDEAAAWVAAMHAANEEGRFLRAYLTFVVSGTA